MAGEVARCCGVQLLLLLLGGAFLRGCQCAGRAAASSEARGVAVYCWASKQLCRARTSRLTPRVARIDPPLQRQLVHAAPDRLPRCNPSPQAHASIIQPGRHAPSRQCSNAMQVHALAHAAMQLRAAVANQRQLLQMLQLLNSPSHTPLFRKLAWQPLAAEEGGGGAARAVRRTAAKAGMLRHAGNIPAVALTGARSARALLLSAARTCMITESLTDR